MHLSNKLFWEHVYETYHDHLVGTIYEYGSHNVNSGLQDPVLNTSRDASVHIGIDWREGPNVDVVSIAHEATFDEQADAILSASMLEHDPYYEQSLPAMVSNLKDGGLIALSWGAAYNTEHCHDHSPDGRFLPLKAGIVINRLQDLGVTIIEFLYEGNRYEGGYAFSDGMGEVCLVGIKGDYSGPVQIDDLLEADIES